MRLRFRNQDLFTVPEKEVLLLPEPGASAQRRIKKTTPLSEEVTGEFTAGYQPYKAGLNYLKNNQYEKAVNAFLENLENDPECTKTRFNLGLAYLKLENYSEAISEFKQVAALEPGNSEAKLNLAMACQKSENFEQAISEYNTILKLNPSEDLRKKLANAYYLFANKLRKAKKYEEAIANYYKAADYEKKNPLLFHRIGLCYRDLGNQAKASECFENALKYYDNEKKADIYHLMIEMKIRSEEDNEALKLCQKAREICENHPKTSFLAGEIYFRQKEYDIALRKYNAAIKQDPGMVQALLNIGQIYVMKNNLEKALTYYRRVLETEPENTTALCNIALIKYREGNKTMAFEQLNRLVSGGGNNNYLVHKYLGIIWLEKGQIDEAIERFMKSIDLNPADPDNYINLGVCYHKLNNLKRASLEYARALELDRENLVVLKNVALLFFESNRNREAIELYEKILLSEPANKQVIKNLGHSYRRIGDPDKAIDQYLAYLELDENEPEILLNLGVTYFEKNQLIRAIEVFKKLTEASKKYTAQAYCYLSKIYQKNEQYNISLDYAQKAVHLDIKFAEGFVQYGRISLKMGNPRKATSCFQKALKLDPENKTAGFLLKQLWATTDEEDED